MKKVLLVFLSMVCLTGCTLPGLGGNAAKNDIVIASGTITERQIMAHITYQMIEHYLPDTKVGMINNLGSSLLIFQTLIRKDTNVSGTMYTGSSLTNELKLEPERDPTKAYEKVVKAYYEQYGMVWFPQYGFENSYAFMVHRSFAKTHNLENVSDLLALKDTIRVGIDRTWMTRKGDGYEAFKETYGFEFNTIYPMEIGLVYDAIQAGEMDVAVGYSTDGRVNAYDLVLLKDDLRLFPSYDASPLISADVYRAHPEIEAVLLRLEGKISSETMQALNRQSDEDKVEPQVVAKQFLEAHNYFEDATITPLKSRPLYEDILQQIFEEGAQ